MMTHTEYNEEKSPDKIKVKVEVFSQDVENGDWLKCDDFLTILEEGIDKVRKHKNLNEGTVYLFFNTSDDYQVYLEFWGERPETDEEFSKRQLKNSKDTINQKQRDLDRLKHMASSLGYDIIPKKI